jgi:hypothetical protein
MASASAPETKQAEPEQKSSASSWFSATSSPWDTDMQRATRLASTWDSPSSPSAPAASDGTDQVASEVPEAATHAVIEKAALPLATVETIREEAAQVTEIVKQTAEQRGPGNANSYSREESAPDAAAPDAAAPPQTPSMDELVAKVLARMSPDVLQAVTREILKPVVEAMMKEEMKGKKP